MHKSFLTLQEEHNNGDDNDDDNGNLDNQPNVVVPAIQTPLLHDANMELLHREFDLDPEKFKNIPEAVAYYKALLSHVNGMF